MKQFPTYKAHSLVRCHFCNTNLKDAEEANSGFSTGRWCKLCPQCTHFTFYDLEPDPDEERNARIDWEYDKWKDA